MSFSHPKRAPYGALRHSRSSSTLNGLSQARHSRNCFQRRPLRSSHSTQCLFPIAGNPHGVGAAEEDEDGCEGLPTAYATLTTSAYLQLDDSSGSESEYSEYDLVNEQMQDFLLDSDDSTREEDGLDGVLGMGAYCVGGFLAAESSHARLRRRNATPSRRRLAKKSESSASLSSAAARMTPSSSTALLSDLDTNLREAVALTGHGLLRHRKTRRGPAGDRRWLVPAMTPIHVNGISSSTGSCCLPLFTVVFDLDETLVGARYGPIQLRPHVGDLLRALHALPVEIIVWTAGTAHYVNPILHAIGQACGRREWFHHIISRHRRWYTGANTSVKDLTQLGRETDRVVMIENNPISVVQQPDACILVEDYLQANPHDESLRVLQGVLERLARACGETGPSVGSASENTPATGSGLQQGAQGRRSEEAANDPLSAPQRATLPLSALLAADAALQEISFRMEDVCNEDGVSMNQKVELQERVGGAELLLCRALRYSPTLRSTLPCASAEVSVCVRSYGCVNPTLSL